MGPGPHQDSQPRSSSNLKPLEPIAQFHIVKEALGLYVRDNMLNGKSVIIKDFGSFSFEITSSKVLPAQMCHFDTSKDIYGNREDRKHIHMNRPCFLVDGSFKTA